MIIYTNEGNPFGLQLLICSKLAKKSVKVEKTILNEKPSDDLVHLPYLQLDSGNKIISPNAASKYLFPVDGGNRSLRDEWLEWALTRLAPALAHNMAVGHRADPNAKPILNQLVKHLDDALKASNFLTGDKITAADAAVWSLLAPEGTLKGAQNVDNVLRWFHALGGVLEVQESLAILPLKSLVFASLQHSNRFGGLHHINLVPNIKDNELQLLAESPNAIADTVLDEEKELAKQAFKYSVRTKVEEPRTILPKANQKNILITSALPYVNNVPHLGNIIGCVLSADIFARFSRLCGSNTLFVCGTDEYGTATETKALAENLTPQQICDKYFELHNSIYRWFGIGFDYFGRTTTKEQTEIVQKMFLDLHNSGFLETDTVEQLLCQKCNRYLADRFVEGTCPHPGCGYEDARGDQCDGCGKLVNATELVRPRCKVCSTAPVVRDSKQMFLALPKIEPKLREWIDSVESGWTNNARVITKAWLKEGLRSRCITRDLKWGIPVPLKGFEEKVFYVWFDAPIGYISITSRYTSEYKQWWQPAKDTKVDLYQFMAKDNVPFHSVMFPSTLLALNQGHTLVSHIMATEYLNYEDGKFSKSRGIGVFGNDAQDTGIPADVWRFYLAAARPEGQDSAFSWNDLAARNNSELLNNLGNFVNRALVFLEKNFASTIPEMNLNDDDLILLSLINRELKGFVQCMEKAKLRDGIRHLLSVSRHGNQYMQSQQPWVLIKGTDDEKARVGTIIGVECNVACLLATMLFPFMPTTSRNLFDQINTERRVLNADKTQIELLLPPGHKIGKPSPLFAKIEAARIEELKKKFGGVQQTDGQASAPAKYNSLAEVESAVTAQGEKVRALKSSGVEKAVWQPEVAKLLELKKQMTQFSAKPDAKQPSTGNAASSTFKSLAEAESAVAAQGEKVRALKASGVEKAAWQPEVAKLLELKKQMAMFTSKPEAKPTTPQQSTKESAVAKFNSLEEAESAVAAQGEKVRALKASGVEKAVWQPEVTKLLDLKKQLALFAPNPKVADNNKKVSKKGK